MRYIDVEGFAGGFTLGATQAGLTLVGKRELPGGFGVASCEANRRLLGDQWESQVSTWEEWEPVEAEVVIGNPPCSGFSLMSSRSFRGPDSKINSCMWAFAAYVARVQPQVAIFESVQQAYTGGRTLMQDLRTHVEQLTGDRWDLYHVLHNAICVGGCAVRRRYFFVISRVPFGVEKLDVLRQPTLRDAIGDLEDLKLQWEPQPHMRLEPAWWAKPLWDKTVDGHWGYTTPNMQRGLDIIDTWREGEIMSEVAERYWNKHGRMPPSWDNVPLEKIRNNSWHMGFHQLTRWYYDRPARVTTGAACQLVLHPTQDRCLTNREVMRIQGFPDTWRVADLPRGQKTEVLWGKGIAVQCGRWIATWARESIEGWPGQDSGREIGEREFVIQHTHAHRNAYHESYDFRPETLVS